MVNFSRDLRFATVFHFGPFYQPDRRPFGFFILPSFYIWSFATANSYTWGLSLTTWAHEIFLLHHGLLYLFIRPCHKSECTEYWRLWGEERGSRERVDGRKGWEKKKQANNLHRKALDLAYDYFTPGLSLWAHLMCGERWYIRAFVKARAIFNTPFERSSHLEKGGRGESRPRNKPLPPHPPQTNLGASKRSILGPLSYLGRLILLGPWPTLIQAAISPGFPPLFVEHVTYWYVTKFSEYQGRASTNVKRKAITLRTPRWTASITSCRYQMLLLIFGHQQVLQHVQHVQHLMQGGVGGGENTTFIRAYIWPTIKPWAHSYRQHYKL